MTTVTARDLGKAHIHSCVHSVLGPSSLSPSGTKTPPPFIGRGFVLARMLGTMANLLVVEDDDDVRDLTVTILREDGHRVLQAANGGVALVLLEQDVEVDLLFTDIVMPGGPDGLELAHLAKSRRPELKVLYATGFAGLARAGKERPVYGKILNKPYLPTQLCEEIRQLLAR